jgi:hypothetical protein
MWNGLGADSEEKREPAGDIDIAVVDSLKVLDPRRPIREADIGAIWPYLTQIKIARYTTVNCSTELG